MTPHFQPPGDRLSRPTNIARAAAKMADVIRWAERPGLHNIPAELQAALALLPVEPSHKPERHSR
jgi:hypothetical protein